jgi:hypothetical protein
LFLAVRSRRNGRQAQVADVRIVDCLIEFNSSAKEYIMPLNILIVFCILMIH